MATARLRKWYGHVASMPCLVCYGSPVEVAHFKGLLSPKTGLRLGRRQDLNAWAVLPLCADHHRTGTDCIHQLGERKFFEVVLCMTEDQVVRMWAYWLVKWLEEGGPQ
jgi:hypothetical protein